MRKRVALYLRVSTTTHGQTTENQRRELVAVGERLGWEVIEVFEDMISGSKGRQARPGLDALMKGVARRSFDLIAAWSVDRLGRSLQDLIGLLNELHAKKVDLYLHQQGLDTTTPAGRAMFSMLGVFAEFERAIIQERIKSGLARAKANGRRLGRKPVSAEVEENIRKARLTGLGILRIARELGVGTSVVQRVVREMQKSDANGLKTLKAHL